jgi:hypothetical protein
LASDKIIFCPKCKKPVEAKDYFSTSGLSDWRVESAGGLIRCSECDYSGPPLEATLEGYKKIRKRR